MENEWVYIGHMGHYRINSLGEVESCTRGRGRYCKDRISKWEPVKPVFGRSDYTGAGYYKINIRTASGARKMTSLHRLVAESFCEKKPGCNEVDHIDGDRSNNKASNLRWATRAENAKNAKDRGAFKGLGQGKGKKLNLNSYKVIRDMIESGHKNKDIAKMIGVDRSNISKIRNGHLMQWAEEEWARKNRPQKQKTLGEL